MESIKKNFPLVSVIIVNWNGGKIFNACLKSLSKISYSQWELIVVDNGSNDGSESLIEKYNPPQGCHLIKNRQNVGFALANNQGSKIAKGKYLLLLNNDTKVRVDFLSKLVGRIEMDQYLAVVQPKICLMDNPGFLDNAGSFFTKIGFLYHWGFMKKDGNEFKKEREIFSAKGACMLVRKSVIDKVGLFDNDFKSYFEESDFCWRVWLLGYKVLFYPQAKIYHKLGFTIRRLDVLNLNYHYYKNRICSLIKNLGQENLLPVLSVHIFLSLGIMAVFLLQFYPRSAFLVIKALWWNIVYLPETLSKRKKIQNLRKATDKEIFARVSFGVKWKKYFDDFKRVKGDFKKKHMIKRYKYI